MEKYERAVFISYAWGEEREEIVDQIVQALKERGLHVIRDKVELGYKGSIKGFMERIGRGSCVIVVISDKYLRSPNCMFELLKIAENKEFEKRIFPIVLADADIYKPANQVKYIKYWEAQIKELNDSLEGVGRANLSGIYEQVDLYDEIRDNISKLTAILTNMNALTPEMHKNSQFSSLYDAIVNQMKESAKPDDGQPRKVEAVNAGSVKKFATNPVFKYGIPAAIGFILLFAFIFNGGNPASETDTPTPPTTPQASITPPINVTLPTIATTTELTIIPDITTESAPATNTPTQTVSPTLPQTFSLSICIYAIDSNANIRKGPGTSYDILGKIDTDGSKCPSFRARIVNVERQVWFQFAPNQQAEFQPYAEQWISGSSLAAFDLPRPLPLPICIYTTAGMVNVHNLPGITGEIVGNPIIADGTKCPFFTTREQTLNDGIWYQFAPNQKAKVEFQDYAGGWIHEDSLVIRTFTLPVITLTPIPGLIPTLTSTPSPTPTITPSSTPTATDTDTPVPTETPTP